MGKFRDMAWDSPKIQFDTIMGRDMDKAENPYKGLAGNGAGMTAKQKADYLARQKAKGSEVTLSPLTDRYS